MLSICLSRIIQTPNILRLSHLVMMTANILRMSPPDYAYSKHSQFVSPGLCRLQTFSDCFTRLCRPQTFLDCLFLSMQTPNILRLSPPDYTDSEHSRFASLGLCRFQTCSDCLSWLWWLKTFSDCLHLVMKTPNIFSLSLLDYADSKHSQIVSLWNANCKHTQFVYPV